MISVQQTDQKRPEMQVDHWYLWASNARVGVDVGFYSQQPFYVEAGYRVSPPVFTDEDKFLSDRIAAAVRYLKSSDPRAAMVLIEYYGAYPGAQHLERDMRMRKLNLSASNAKRIRQGAENWVGGFVEASRT